MVRAIFPGTFDPLHNGHFDIAVRASVIFDELIVAVYDAPPKKLLFSTEERVALAQKALAHLGNVSIVSYVGLTVECARQHNAQVMVRGLRNVIDFPYEQQIDWGNHELSPDVESCCLFCRGEFALLSSTLLKEVAGLGGDVTKWAPPHVVEALHVRLNLPAPPNQKRVTRTEGKFDRKS